MILSYVQHRNSHSSSADVFPPVLTPRPRQHDVHTLRHRSIVFIFRGLSWAFFVGRTFETNYLKYVILCFHVFYKIGPLLVIVPTCPLRFITMASPITAPPSAFDIAPYDNMISDVRSCHCFACQTSSCHSKTKHLDLLLRLQWRGLAH